MIVYIFDHLYLNRVAEAGRAIQRWIGLSDVTRQLISKYLQRSFSRSIFAFIKASLMPKS